MLLSLGKTIIELDMNYEPRDIYRGFLRISETFLLFSPLLGPTPFLGKLASHCSKVVICRMWQSGFYEEVI